METKKTSGSYVYMAIASIGMLLLAVGMLEYMSLLGNAKMLNFFLAFLGFIILVQYISYLEKKNGVSNKVIWIRSVLLLISLLTLTNFFL